MLHRLCAGRVGQRLAASLSYHSYTISDVLVLVIITSGIVLSADVASTARV